METLLSDERYVVSYRQLVTTRSFVPPQHLENYLDCNLWVARS